MNVLLVTERGVGQLQLLDATRQAAEPGRGARFDTEHQLALFLFEHRTADRKTDGEQGNQQQAEPPGFAAEQEEILQGQGLEIRNRR